MPLRSVGDAFDESWRLKWPFLLSHLTFSLLAVAVLAPLTTLTLRAAIRLSGQPALSDFDIALYLFSPVGFVALMFVASLLLTTYVLDISFMMAIALNARTSGHRSFEEGVVRILPRTRQIIGFSWRLLLRILALTAPFIVVSLVVAQRLITEYDINYYLTVHPPEFLQAVGIIGVVLLVMTAVLLRNLLNWSLSLSLVLFQGTHPRHCFRQSAERMQGKRWSFFLTLLVWGALSTLVVALMLGGVRGVAGLVIEDVGLNLELLAGALLVLTALWWLLNLLGTAVTTGALACLLMERADWPGIAGLQVNERRERRLLRLSLFAGLALGGIGFVVVSADLARTRLGDDVQIIAHRGAAGERPENTMAAFDLAIENKADWVELDVQEDSDGVVIVAHDSDFMKLAGKDLKVWDATAAELAEIDIGSWFGPDYAGERTPTLLEVLELAKDSGSGVLIELKYYGHDQMLEQRVADIVEQAGMADQVQLMSLKYDAVKKMKALRPDWTVGLLATATMGRPWELEADFLAVNKDMVSHRLVRQTEAAGKRVHVWTVNDPLAMSHMLSLGVSGLITDEPAIARAVMEQRAELGTLERLVLAMASQIGLAASQKVYRDGSP
jgi:glycerophosphoryl diester phosphodiesterase